MFLSISMLQCPHYETGHDKDESGRAAVKFSVNDDHFGRSTLKETHNIIGFSYGPANH